MSTAIWLDSESRKLLGWFTEGHCQGLGAGYEPVKATAPDSFRRELAKGRIHRLKTFRLRDGR